MTTQTAAPRSPYWPDCPADCPYCAEKTRAVAAGPARTERLVDRGLAIVRRLLARRES